MYYNYKNFFSIVLQAVADANYKFITIDVGGYGKQSDRGTFRSSSLFYLMERLSIPSDATLPSTAGSKAGASTSAFLRRCTTSKKMPALPGNDARKDIGRSFHHRKPMQRANTTNDRHFSEPSLTIASLNVEGITQNKQDLISQLCQIHKWDILCLQETHRDEQAQRPKIEGMRLVIETPHNKYGSAIFIKPDINITSSSQTVTNGTEILTIECGPFTVTSVYKPPGEKMELNMPEDFGNQTTQFIIGDFNCHSINWGYKETDTNGSILEEWLETKNFSLLHDSKLPCSFMSKIWKRGYNPDNCFVSNNIQDCCVKNVYEAIPKTQHRPIGIQVFSAVRYATIPFRRRFNFKKAKWVDFTKELDEAINKVDATPNNYPDFVDILRKVSRKHIPRGCRQNYIPGMTNNTKDTLTKYEELYSKDPFSEETITCGTTLMTILSETRQKKWIQTLEKMDMKHSSKIAWNLIKKLDGDPRQTQKPSKVTANQVAHQLLLNGKLTKKDQNTRLHRNICSENNFFAFPFTIKELNDGINMLKNGKAAGVDDMCVEQIKHFGPDTKNWLLELFNNCRETFKIPKLWKKSKVVALLKPGKDPNSPNSYRPISLLCHLSKLYERLILNRISNIVDPKIIPQQAGFRPGKSCTNQILALTEHIEEGFENKAITGLVLVDLTAAYDTVNQRKMLSKVYDTTRDYKLMKIIESLQQNRRFYVTLEGRKSRWRNQKNGLAQGSVLAPILFNIYTNDQPTPEDTKHFVYADDLAITAQARTFEEVEVRLENALSVMSAYYEENSLKPNPSKTQVSVFHLHTRLANYKLNVAWNGETLEHTDKPVYLGVTLDRSLTYKHHCEKTRQKVASRNNILRKLTHSKWGAKPEVLRTTAQALCFSTAEYACPVWSRSTHARKVDVSLNETCRLVTGCMKAAPLAKLYQAAGVHSPASRREAHEFSEKFKKTFDNRHPLYDQYQESRRLKSRRRFLSSPLDEPPANYPLTESLPSGVSCNYRTWKMLNRIRTGVAPVKTNMIKWGLAQPTDDKCDCGTIQDMEHLLKCANGPAHCNLDDLWQSKPEALDVAQYWAEKL